MDIWIVTVGWYEDQQVVGVALSPEAADRMVIRARMSGRFRTIEDFGSGDDCPTYEIAGPFTPDEIYNGNGERV